VSNNKFSSEIKEENSNSALRTLLFYMHAFRP